MERSRTKAATINAVFSIVYQMVNIISSLIIPPLIIVAFGSTYNGLLATIRQILTYAQLLGAGISTAAMQELYKPLHENDKTKINRMLNGVSKTFNHSGLLYTVTFVALAGIYPLFVEGINYWTVLMLFVILGCAGVTEFFFFGKYRTLLMADQHGYVVSIVQTIGTILNVVASYILLKLTNNIVYMQLGATLAYSSRIIIPIIFTKKHYAYIYEKHGIDLSGIKKRRDVVVHTLMGTLTLNSQLIIISLFVGLNDASIFSVYNLIFYGIYLILNNGISSFTSSIGSYMMKADPLAIIKMYRTFQYALNIVIFVIYTTTLVMIYSFVGLYTRGATDICYQDVGISLLFIVYGILNTWRFPAITMINATGHFAETKRGAIVETAIAMILQLILVQIWGIYGLLVGIIIALLFRSNDLVIYVNKKIVKTSNCFSYFALLLNVLMMAVIAPMIYMLLPDITSWINWVVVSILVATITSVIIYSVNAIIFKCECIDLKRYISIIGKGILNKLRSNN